jgi:hypothetical protein
MTTMRPSPEARRAGRPPSRSHEAPSADGGIVALRLLVERDDRAR